MITWRTWKFYETKKNCYRRYIYKISTKDLKKDEHGKISKILKLYTVQLIAKVKMLILTAGFVQDSTQTSNNFFSHKLNIGRRQSYSCVCHNFNSW